MCGIIGYIGSKNATDVLINGLKHLEYRGYDSAGVAVRTNGHVTVKRAEGKLENLVSRINGEMPHGTIGIGHTRWATHGKPCEVNAHPHCDGRIFLVHNGIIENHVDLKQELAAQGQEFVSDTDTEIACHLISSYTKKGMDVFTAMREALKRISGSYAFVIMDGEDPDTLYFARKRSPLIIGVGEQENFIASDIPAILSYTRQVIFLADGEIGKVTRAGVEVYDLEGRPIPKRREIVNWNPLMAQKGGFKHFMLKEIFEQPKSVADTFAGRLFAGDCDINLPELDTVCGHAGAFPYKTIYIVACGTSYHAALIGKYWIEELCRIPVNVELGSEFRYRNPLLGPDVLVIAISQSGETADTLAATDLVRAHHARMLAVCNVVGSSLAREADATIFTHAGPEIGVASTKAFTSQLAVLAMIAVAVAKKLGKVERKFIQERIDEFLLLPRHMQTILDQHQRIREIAKVYADAPQVLFIGRGTHYPVALEGALKLKEISYIHSEGFAGGELKHGPIALIEPGLPVVVLTPSDATFDKILINVQEVKARGADIVALGSPANPRIADEAKFVIDIPEASPFVSPILYSLPLQLFAYYVADYKGTDVDQPRNLAKSVTVE